MRLNGTSVFSSIKLGEGNKVPREVQVLRVGKFNHPKYGFFEILPQTLAEMKSNHDNRVRGIDLSFDYFHESDKEAAAWVPALELREDGTELWAVNVEWTPRAEQKLNERELRYFSPDFAFKWTDPEKGLQFDNVLFGGGLTNRPFVKEMKAIVANETKGENMTDLEKAQARVKELEAQNVKLSEDMGAMQKKMDAPPPAAGDDKVKALEAQIQQLQAQLAQAKQQQEVEAAEKVKAQGALQAAQDKVLATEKENKFNLLLSEGKAVAAQKDAFMKGNMEEFIKLARPVNLKGSGNSATDAGDVDAAAIIKLAEEKQKADPKLDRGSAISLAKKELKK